MQPKLSNYRNYKFFNNGNFKNVLIYGIQQLEHLVMKILNYHAPQKTRLIKANNSPFMRKELCKAIMMRPNELGK